MTAPAEMARQGWRRDRKEREEEEHRGQRGGGRGHKAAQCGVHNQIEGAWSDLNWSQRQISEVNLGGQGRTRNKSYLRDLP